MTKRELIDRLSGIMSDLEFVVAGFDEDDCALNTEDAEWLIEVHDELEDMIREYK